MRSRFVLNSDHVPSPCLRARWRHADGQRPQKLPQGRSRSSCTNTFLSHQAFLVFNFASVCHAYSPFHYTFANARNNARFTVSTRILCARHISRIMRVLLDSIALATASHAA